MCTYIYTEIDNNKYKNTINIWQPETFQHTASGQIRQLSIKPSAVTGFCCCFSKIFKYFEENKLKCFQNAAQAFAASL